MGQLVLRYVSSPESGPLLRLFQLNTRYCPDPDEVAFRRNVRDTIAGAPGV